MDRQAVEQPDGTLVMVDITVTERIIQSLRAGNYFEQSCAAAGIHPDTAYGWLTNAARLRIANNGERPKRPGKHDTACLDFSEAVARADSEWEVRSNLQLEMLGRGGHQTITVTEKINPETNEVIERTVKTDTHPPDAKVLMWRLERRHPDRYGYRVEVTPGLPQLSAAEHAQAILDAIDGIVGAAPVELGPGAEVIDVEEVPVSSNGDGGGTFT